MAKYQLAEGETELGKELVEGVRNGKRVPNSRVIVTDRRVVLLVPKADAVSKIVGALFGRLGSRLAMKPEMTHQILRADFAEVEVYDGKMLVFRNKGEGYAHISFEVYARSAADVWQARMRHWAGGELEPLAKSFGG